MVRVTVAFLLLHIGYSICDSVSDNVHSQVEIPKCCGENEAILMTSDDNKICVSIPTGELSYSHVTVYDKDVHDKPTNKSLRAVPDKKPNETDFQWYYFDTGPDAFVSEDGLLYMEFRNAYTRWMAVNNSLFCVDYLVEEVENSTELKLQKNPSLWCSYFGEKPIPTNLFYPFALLVSVVFLILVLIVYSLLPSLRNLGGMVLMAYVLSLLMAFLFLSIIQLFRHEPGTCIALTTLVYFSFLASFCWMTVMSCDIWWTFRGYAKARPIHRRGENFKFLMYCLYGWGVPLAMSVFFVVINGADLSHIPWFIKPQVPDMGCFLEGGQKLVYLYYPMLILILCNWMFFLMTAFNIWRLQRGTAVLDSPAAGTPQAHRNQRNRLFIYLKLSIIMGINWILEVVSSLTPDFDFWYISDAYNLLIGLAIFLIFVCKKKIYLSLKARFAKNQMPLRSLTKSQTSSTTLSSVSQDTPLQVIHHPNGITAKDRFKYLEK